MSILLLLMYSYVVEFPAKFSVILQIQELRGNIRVFCRCRYDSSGPCALQFDGGERLSCVTHQGRRKVFEFEKVYTPVTTQEEVGRSGGREGGREGWMDGWMDGWREGEKNESEDGL